MCQDDKTLNLQSIRHCHSFYMGPCCNTSVIFLLRSIRDIHQFNAIEISGLSDQAPLSLGQGHILFVDDSLVGVGPNIHANPIWHWFSFQRWIKLFRL